MLRKFKNNMLWFNMCLTSTIVILAFVFIYILNANSIENDIQSSLFQDLKSPPDKKSLDETIDKYLANNDYPSILITISSSYYKKEKNDNHDDEKSIEPNIQSSNSLDKDLYRSVINAKKKTGKAPKEIHLYKRYWRYALIFVDDTVLNTKEYMGDTDKEEPYYQFLFFDVTDYKRSLTQLKVVLIFSSIFVLIGVYIVSYYVASHAIKPVELTWQKQKEFILNASHELKTPLTIIQANTEVLSENKKETIESQKHWIENINLGSERMNKLIDSLLLLTKYDKSDHEIEQYHVNGSDVVQNVFRSMEAKAKEKGIIYKEKIRDNYYFYINEQALMHLSMILIDNAVKYTPSGETVLVSLFEHKHKTVLRVSNSGNPIPIEKTPYIFDRFYRCDDSRNNQISGYGLGLSIAKEIAGTIRSEIRVVVTSNDINHFEVIFG